MRKIFSFAGRILRVDLTSGKMWTECTDQYALSFLGGRGVNQWILFKEVKPWMTAFDPGNRLIFGSGALVGTLAPCATRLTVDAKSPVTGGVGSGNSCGFFSAELKFAGYDHIVFQGRARSPVYLWIDDGKAELRDASFLWGKSTWETEEILKNKLGDEQIQIASIGPAGENLARTACIITNQARAVGRCGLGAVMGSKNLKAVAVRGKLPVEVARPKAFMAAVDHALEVIRKSERANDLKQWGTYGRATKLNEACLYPVRNFQDDFWDPSKLQKLLPEAYKTNWEVRRQGYLACPFYCSHLYEVETGNCGKLLCEGFEFNSIWNFMSRLDIDDPSAVIRLHAFCNKYGLDIDSSSCVIAWAIECYERGILTEEDTDGLKLEWGNEDVVLELLRKIAHRQGIGDILAEGCQKASSLVGRGAERYAVHLKGQDSMEAMRAAKGWALGCCVSTRGGTHTRGANLVELSHEVIDPELAKRLWGISKVEGPSSYEGKAQLVTYYEKLQAIVDSLGVCLFSSVWWSPDLLTPEDYARLYSAATGYQLDGQDLLLIGERIHNIEKAFNTLHASFTREDDYPPLRFTEEVISSGPLQGERLMKEKWDRVLDEYYELHGWDKATSWQTAKCLQKLGLQAKTTL